MCLPALIWMLFFNAIPMLGIRIAFIDFSPKKGIFDSKYVGLKNFKYLFSMKDTWRIVGNTFVIAIGKLVLNLILPLAFALLLNEVKNKRYKSIVQTVTYLPHFVSWVVLANILTKMFGYSGLINTLGKAFGKEPEVFLANADFFRKFLIFTDSWKELGFNAIIYLAALTKINPNLYEAAAIDGANKWRSMTNITLPSLKSTVVLLGTLSMGNVLNAGFDQVFNMYNPLVYSTSDIIDTWVYRIGLISMNYSVATCAGLFKSLVSFVLISLAYILAYKFADYTIF